MRLAFWQAGKAKAAVQRAVSHAAFVKPASSAAAPAIAYRPEPVSVADSSDLDIRALGQALARKRGWIIVPTVLALVGRRRRVPPRNQCSHCGELEAFATGLVTPGAVAAPPPAP